MRRAASPLALLAALACHAAPAIRAAAPPVAEAFGSPAQDVALALEDITRFRPMAERANVRYLSLYHMTLEERQQMILALAVHANSLSTRPKLVLPAVLSQRSRTGQAVPVLLRVDMTHYGWTREVWERLAAVNVYYNVTREVAEVVRGKRVKREAAVAARWLPREQAGLLLLLTGSQTPIVRADWFFVQTVVQKNRVAGYYDWLGVKNRDDFFRLTGADYKKAQRAGKEWHAVIQQSGVAQRNRQVVRFGVLDAGGWFTRDAFKTETRRRNAINFLGSDFQHDAEEHIIPLPNGLYAYFLCDDKGVRQDTAPPDVGPDKTSTSNDHEIHAYLSCIRCHSEGLNSLADYGRKLLTDGRLLGVVKDKKKFEELEALYLRPLERHLARDVAQYGEYLAEVTDKDFTADALSNLYRDVWKRWRDDLVPLEQAAREVGTASPADIQEALTLYALDPAEGGLGKLLPLSLLGFTKNKPLSMLREQWEESVDAVHLILEETAALRRKRK